MKAAVQSCLEQLQSAYSDLNDEPHTSSEFLKVVRCIEEQFKYWASLVTYIQSNPLNDRQSSVVLEVAPLVSDETDFLSMVVNSSQFIGSDPDDISAADIENCQRRMAKLVSYYEDLGLAGLPSLSLSP